MGVPYMYNTFKMAILSYIFVCDGAHIGESLDGNSINQ